MITEFIEGIIQGILLGTLLSSLSFGFFGQLIAGISYILGGFSAFSGLIILGVANLVFFFLFARHGLRKNPIIFVFGLVIAFALALF